MKEKLFSIIIPAYNAESTIERTLASLISNKDYIYEIIVVNDRCTDKTIEKVEQFKKILDNIIIIENKGNPGPGPARREGINIAKGKYITFVDSDDCLTPSCLYYVYKKIKENINCTIVYAKTIFYESGKFNEKDINFCDNSCGGSFYRRSYIKKNNLYPHDSLYMAEDEYFNKKIELFLKYCDEDKTEYIVYLDYPVYEVHHDMDFRMSLATSNWTEYICKYHSLYTQYIVEDMIKYEKLYGILKNEAIDSFIFIYFACCSFLISKNEDFIFSDYKKYFLNIINLLKKYFNIDEDDLIYEYKNNKENSLLLLGSVIASTGFHFNMGDGIDFEKFIEEITKDQT